MTRSQKIDISKADGGRDIITIKLYQAKKILENEKTEYSCFITKTRLKGYCELLIWNRFFNEAECHILIYSSKTVCRQQIHLSRMQAQNWLADKNYMKISYNLAQCLVSDAMIHHYNFFETEEFMNGKNSRCMKRIQSEWQEYPRGIQYLLVGKSLKTILESYFLAIENGDAALIYDLMSDEYKNDLKEARSLSMSKWNHPLDGIEIYDIFSDGAIWNDDGTYAEAYFTVYGVMHQEQRIAVDIRIEIVRGPEGYRIHGDQTLDARIAKNVSVEI